ncbi:hypothetical protein BUALT_Bualt04G0089600 [Buddleja alternifolia]|uniref:DRBM domain-containing protein n=1 Tax=Buddleja alternifolia TaxID=168488 RepID=A0AAV6XPH0_9LAMI|nr:hypothetical protein BUALT_Bualt04G0089600 [Buddleja alternifolia]
MSVSQSPTPPPGVPEEAWCKNRLQEFTQKASIPLPMYETFNEGTQHAHQFRSRVWVDGTCFMSPNTFSIKKMAEQDAAKHALIGIQEKIKSEGCARVLEETIFCKSIINQYALKMNLSPPTYVTNVSKMITSVFVSSLILNGDTFIGYAGKTKKESEQLAARAAILSILGSESGTTMSEIVRSKFKFYDELKKVKDAIQGGTTPAGLNQSEERVVVSSFNERKEFEVNEGTINASCSAILPSSTTLSPAIQVALSDSTSEQPSYTQATNQSPHVFKKAETQTSSVPIDLPIVFVPPAPQQPLVSSTSGKKRKRKNKKAKRNVEYQPPLTSHFLHHLLEVVLLRDDVILVNGCHAASACTPSMFSGPMSQAVIRLDSSHVSMSTSY